MITLRHEFWTEGSPVIPGSAFVSMTINEIRAVYGLPESLFIPVEPSPLMIVERRND